jgi:two-component system C4-dicarboxylate transport response regulator DctD
MFESEFFGHEAGAFAGASKMRVGKIEHASHGTLFLDEIDSMPTSIQAKLLHALQDRAIERLGSNRGVAVDIRPIAASKRDLRKASTEGQFRSDLYYRLSVVELTIPPLRDRIEDIPLLLDYFAALAASAHGREVRPVPPETMNMLMAHTWPGNVRELRNAAERHVLGFADTLIPDEHAEAGQRRTLAERVEAFERILIERCLVETGGRISLATELLGIPRRTLSEKIIRLGIDRRRFRNADGPNVADDVQPVGGKLPTR